MVQRDPQIAMGTGMYRLYLAGIASLAPFSARMAKKKPRAMAPQFGGIVSARPWLPTTAMARYTWLRGEGYWPPT